MLRLAEPPTGRARLRSSLESPRNPITPIETSRVATLHPGLYKRLREGARRVIGATAKPLYPIDGKAAGLDRRSPRPPSSREGDRPVGGGRSSSPPAVEGVRGVHHVLPKILLHMLHMHHMSKAYDVFFKNRQVSFRRMSRSSACFFHRISVF